MNRNRILMDSIFSTAAFSAAGLIIAIVVAIFMNLVYHSRLSLSEFGAHFLVSSEWNPATGKFGALSSIYGTLIAAAIAMVVAVPLSFLTAFFLVETSNPTVASPINYAIELLAAIPSIIYGMWGLFVLAPIMANHVQPFLKDLLGWLPLFSGPPMGIGMLTAGIILALMILPFMTAVTKEALEMTPRSLREAAFGIGSTPWEVTTHIALRYGIEGVSGGFFLGLGRALAETMAVTFVIGNDHRISASLFHPANTIASTLANEFAEASDPLYLSSLTELGLILFGITFVVNSMAFLLLKRYRPMKGAKR